MTEGITMIQTPKSGIFCWVLHSYQSDLKEFEVFGSDLLALSIPFANVLVAW